MKSPERLRAAFYGAFAALALAAVLLAWGSLRLERERADDTLLLQLATSQRGAVAEVGRVGALQALQRQQAQPGPARQDNDETGDLAARQPLPASAQAADPVLEQALAQSTADAQRLDKLLAATVHSATTQAATAAWQLARASLRSSVEVALPPRHDAAGLQTAVHAAAAAATRLADSLAADASQHAARSRLRLQAGLAGLALLLVVLALAVVEPAARAARRGSNRRAAQAAELRRMALVAEHTSALVLVTDRDDRVQWANAAFSALSGWSQADAIGRRPGELMASAQADDSVLARVDTAILQGNGLRHEWMHRTRHGRDLWLDVDLRPLHTRDGELTGFVRVAADMTARVQQQSKLQALWAVLPVGVVVHDVQCRVVEANRAAERLLGRTVLQLQDESLRLGSLRPVRDDGSAYTAADHPAARTLATGEALRNETLGLDIDGQRRWLLFNTEPQRDAQGQISGVVSCITDITERRQLQEKLIASARTDALTRLPNRTVVMERLQRALAHGRRHPGYGFAVLFMDFDRFKLVNDSLGHAAGDELLRQIARRLELALRPGDAVARLPGAPHTAQGASGAAEAAVAARLGGDEFVVVLEGVADARTVGLIAQRLVDNLAEPYTVDNMPLTTSVSIGVVLCADFRHDGDGGVDADSATALSADDVLRNADTAMYEAKRAGRARWVMFDDSMHERVVRALALENDLRRALVHDELFVVYQPVVNLRTRALDGVEALVRWRHPQRGLVAPVDFIGVAEESGLIHQLGATVLRKACMQFMHWRRTPGAPAPQQLAVNLSRAQLERDDLADEVRTVLQDCGMAPGLLQLEVTESLAAQGDRVQATLRELKTLGVRLALDDFGTGYSSLACLHQMPVDTVKIDRSFVQHAETVEYHRVLIEATIRVARTLGMTTVAEGIETEGQAELMRQLECDRGQGYLYSRPLEAAALERWVQQTQRETADTL